MARTLSTGWTGRMTAMASMALTALTVATLASSPALADRDRGRDWDHDRGRHRGDRHYDSHHHHWYPGYYGPRLSLYLNSPYFYTPFGWAPPPRRDVVIVAAPPAVRQTIIWNDATPPALSPCQARVHEGLAGRFGYARDVRYEGSPLEGSVTWNGTPWNYRCTDQQVNIWQ